MVACLKCELPNSVDSRFCRGCGEPLPAEALDAALREHEQLVLEGHRLLADHRYDEATLIAERALEENPQSVVALTLRGDCYERRGKIVEALECYEKLVELKPDSTLDRIKLTQLRNILASTPIRAEDNRKKSAAFAGVGIALGAIAFGLWGIDRLTKPDGTKTDGNLLAANNGSHSLPMNADYSEPILNGTEQARPRPGDELGIGNDKTGATTDTAKTGAGSGRDLPSLTPNNRNSGVLPPTGGGLTGSIEESVKPITPDVVKINPEDPPAKNTNEGDPPPVEDNTPKNEEKPGIIEITPSKNGGDPGKAEGDAAMFRRIARDQFMAGRYQQSAESYQRALKAGAPAGMVYQRLGQCYDKLGKTADSITAYRKAIVALSAGGAAGANQAAIDACQNAIKALGG